MDYVERIVPISFLRLDSDETVQSSAAPHKQNSSDSKSCTVQTASTP